MVGVVFGVVWFVWLVVMNDMLEEVCVVLFVMEMVVFDVVLVDLLVGWFVCYWWLYCVLWDEFVVVD